ncbi:MAG: dienelactone hydrolase family protein [Alphaproteobacteria bacterium]|nr:dienelactone hydrolase family protein [Alphaproteobacteria bacterium]
MPDITINGRDGDFSAYLSTPAGGSGPGLLVIQEIFGVNQSMRQMCDDFAAQGFVALCPDIFWRQEPGIQITDKSDEEWQRAFQLFQGFDVDKGIEDLKDSLAALRDLDACGDKAGTVGYCLGGKLAFLMATRSDADCNVGYYGVGLDELLGEAGNISTPLMLHVAEKDDYCPPETQAKLRDALESNRHTALHFYAGMPHAFARAGGIHYDAQAATLANGRTYDFLKQHLG